MNALQALLDEYIATRRALGASLKQDAAQLQSFVEFAARHKAAFLTTQLALQWATESPETQQAQKANRLSMVRGFARYARGADSRHEVPPQGLLPRPCHRARPYIYSDAEIASLIDAARELSGRTGLRPCTYSTLLGLLAATGMRPSEPLQLDRNDVDLASGVLTVRCGKFGRPRYIPVHESTRQVLSRYADRRDHLCPHATSPGFFLSERGTRIRDYTLRRTFAKLSRQVGLRGPADSRGPRLHDLRHRFAVKTLVRWYRDGMDVECHLPRLTTYLGHAGVKDTYWYLTATPELLELAARRLDRAARRYLS